MNSATLLAASLTAGKTLETPPFMWLNHIKKPLLLTTLQMARVAIYTLLGIMGSNETIVASTKILSQTLERRLQRQ